MGRVIAIVSDTHGQKTHRLQGRTLQAVQEADLVLHAGDFITQIVYNAFESECDRLIGVRGNRDSRALRNRLPGTRTIEHEGVRIAMTHGHKHTETSLGLFGRQENADLIVVGHSHRPGFRESGAEVPVLNPGSHADPRGNRAAHAELRFDPFEGRLVQPDGTVFETFRIEE